MQVTAAIVSIAWPQLVVRDSDVGYSARLSVAYSDGFARTPAVAAEAWTATFGRCAPA